MQKNAILTDLFFILEHIYTLKKLLRQGWIRSGVSTCSIESIADHSFGTAVIAYLLASLESQHDSTVNPHLIAVKALFHDYLESFYLDLDRSIEQILSPIDAKTVKTLLENGALEYLWENISLDAVKESLMAVISIENEKERAIVRIADKLELLFQARDYQARNLLSKSETEVYFKSMEIIKEEMDALTCKDVLEQMLLAIKP